jgi:Flp pilus assembly protein TadG
MSKSRCRNEAGQTLPMILMFMVCILLFAGLVIDLGQAYRTRIQLQASADAASLAGAARFPDAATANSTAYQYSAKTGSKNSIPGVPNVAVNVQTTCSKTLPNCVGANTVVVDETANVPTTFLGLLGIKSIPVKVHATACSPCNAVPLDVMFVLDRTGSMCEDSNGNSDPNCTDLVNARSGMMAFLGEMDSSIDRVGLAVFPPAASQSKKCSTPSSTNNYAYNSTSAPYVIVPLSNDYKAPGPTGAINPTSNLVSTINCVKGGGGTAYATAIDKARTELENNGRSNAWKVLILLTDGAANTAPSYYASNSPYKTQPCHQGINSSQIAKNEKYLVYAIGYDLNATAAGTNICQNANTGGAESPTITTQATLQALADPGSFYDHPSATDLAGVFTRISADIAQGTSRLFDDGT